MAWCPSANLRASFSGLLRGVNGAVFQFACGEAGGVDGCFVCVVDNSIETDILVYNQYLQGTSKPLTLCLSAVVALGWVHMDE